MVEAIVPVVHGGKRGRYALSVVLHVLGAGISAALLGAILGAVGGLLGAPWGVAGLVALATVALAYALRESAGLPVPIPDRHQQVPEWWRSFYSPPVSAFLYGLGLGPGFFTFLTFGTFVAVAVAAVVSGDPALGALLCAPFGVARGLSVLVSARTHSGDDAGRVIDRLESVAATPGPRLANAVVLAGLAAAALLAL
jgi:hypothetical protein